VRLLEEGELNKDTFGEFEIEHSESPPIVDTKTEEKVEEKPKKIEMKELDKPPTKFTDGSPYYAHKVPEKYSPGNEFLRDWERVPHDTLMNTLVSKYAWEGKDKDTGKPNGRYFIDRDGALKAFKPFEEKYLKLKDHTKLEDFYKFEFEDQFKHYDVLDEGFIEVE